MTSDAVAGRKKHAEFAQELGFGVPAGIYGLRDYCSSINPQQDLPYYDISQKPPILFDFGFGLPGLGSEFLGLEASELQKQSDIPNPQTLNPRVQGLEVSWHLQP